MASVDLSKVDPKFRLLTDLLFYTDNFNIDNKEFVKLLRSNYNYHKDYFTYRFSTSSEIFWNKEIWRKRLSFILNINDAKFNSSIEKIIEKNFFNLIKIKNKINHNHDVELIIFLEYCYLKKTIKNDNLLTIKNRLLTLPLYTKFEKIIHIITYLVPTVFSSFDEYANLIYKSSNKNPRNIDFILSLKKDNIIFNEDLIAKVFYKIIKSKYIPNAKLRKVMFKTLEYENILNIIKKDFSKENKEILCEILPCCNFTEYEDFHFKNVKNLLKLDESLADIIIQEYLSQIFLMETLHKKSKFDKIIKLLKNCDKISNKKILMWLSSNKKTNEIKYLIDYYPDLKKLAVFV